ncbi:molecular chaperone [Pseudomonas monteilii]|nr:molecular chaperone [Pseudomonas monteilii]
MRFLFFFLLVSAMVPIDSTWANVVIAGTRVIYQANKQEVTLQLSNVGTEPALVQSWIDKDGDRRAPDYSEAPFVIMPPITRISPGRSQTLRIVYTGEQTPSDRESMYWLNILDIPPRPADIATKNYMQISVRSQIKLFFRPEGLSGSMEKAPKQLNWSLVTHDGKTALKVANPGNYHVSLSSVELEVGTTSLPLGSGTVAPGKYLELPLAAPLPKGTGNATVRYSWVNDYGADISESTSI